MAAQYPTALPVFTGTTETAPATTTPSPFAAWSTKVAEEVVALAGDKALSVGPYGTGIWYSTECHSTGSHAPGTGALILCRQDMPPGTTIVQLGEWVVTAAGAGGLRRLCIYNDNGSGYPGTLLVDAGTYDAAAAGAGTFQSTAAFSSVNVSGTKWWGGVSTVAAATMTGITSPSRSMGLATVANGNVNWAGYQQTGVTGALPGTFTSTRSVTSSTPRLFFQIG